MSTGISIEIKREIPEGFKTQKEIVKLRRPMAKDLFGLDFTGVNANKSCAILISRLSSLSEREVEDLEMAQFMKLQNAVTEFINS